MDAMRVTAAAVSCIVLLSPLCAAQNVSVGLQDAPNSVPNCRIFSQFSIGNYSGPMLCSGYGDFVPGAPPCVNITNKVILVTGASTGIGNATAYRLAQAGARVIGTSRYPWNYPEPRPFPLFQLDQTEDDSVKQLVVRIQQEYGHLDALHMNAGRQFVGDLANSDFRQMLLTIDTNFLGALRVLQAALPLLPKTGYARILQTSSVESQYGNENYTPYTASKWALQSLQDSFATSYLNRTNIVYSALLPGSVNTELGVKAIYGCPELYSNSGSRQQVLENYRSELGLEPAQVGEAAFRILVNPQPKLRYLCVSDKQFRILVPIFCRHYTLPAEDWWTWGPDLEPYFSRTFKGNAKFNCSAHYGGAQFGGIGGSLSGQGNGTNTIGSY